MIESPPLRERIIAEGLSILREAKLMCEAVWVDFDENLGCDSIEKNLA